MLILPLSFTDAIQYFKSCLGTSAKPVMLSSSPAPLDPVMFCSRLFPEKPFQLWPRGHSHDEGSVHELVGWAGNWLQLPGGSIMNEIQGSRDTCLVEFVSHLALTFSTCRSSSWGPLTVHRISTLPFWGECPQDFTLISLWVYSQTVHMFISTMNMFYDYTVLYEITWNIFNSG